MILKSQLHPNIVNLLFDGFKLTAYAQAETLNANLGMRNAGVTVQTRAATCASSGTTPSFSSQRR